MKGEGLVKVGWKQVLTLRAWALLWGLWFLVKQLGRRFIRPPGPTAASSVLGNPPNCLVSSAIGRHTYVKIKGTKLHYVEAGEGRDLVLLLHGFPDLWITWRHQIPELSKNYRVIALDLKGFGDSDKPESRYNYDIRGIVEELKELIYVLGYKKCMLIGHDLGGLVGWYLLHTHPSLIEKFVAISSPHPNLYWDSLSSKTPFDNRWIQFCQLPTLPEMRALDNELSVINDVYSHLDNTVENKAFLTAYKYSFSRKEDWTGALNYLRTLILWRLQAHEGCITVPTLLIVGNREPRDFFESVIKSAEYVERHTLKVIENAGHYAHQERPTLVNKTIVTFLRGPEQVVKEAKTASNGLVSRMLGAAVSTTLSYGNGVFDVVKKANPKGIRTITIGNSS